MGFAQKILLSLSVFLNACSHTPTHRPPVDVKFWYGSSKLKALARHVWLQPSEKISCGAPEFDNYIALSSEDFARFFQLFVLGCKDWKKEGFELTEEEKLLLDQMVKGE